MNKQYRFLKSFLGISLANTLLLNLLPMKTVNHVELSRYLGTWYEIANYPRRFQKG